LIKMMMIMMMMMMMMIIIIITIIITTTHYKHITLSLIWSQLKVSCHFLQRQK